MNKGTTRKQMIAINKTMDIIVGVNKIDWTINKNSNEDSDKHLVVKNEITTDNSDGVQINPLHPRDVSHKSENVTPKATYSTKLKETKHLHHSNTKVSDPTSGYKHSTSLIRSNELHSGVPHEPTYQHTYVYNSSMPNPLRTCSIQPLRS